MFLTKGARTCRLRVAKRSRQVQRGPVVERRGARGVGTQLPEQVDAVTVARGSRVVNGGPPDTVERKDETAGGHFGGGVDERAVPHQQGDELRIPARSSPH